MQFHLEFSKILHSFSEVQYSNLPLFRRQQPNKYAIKEAESIQNLRKVAYAE